MRPDLVLAGGIATAFLGGVVLLLVVLLPRPARDSAAGVGASASALVAIGAGIAAAGLLAML